jgi:ubiquinone/menaquinone biosynthesis C-methylase UbiE
VTHVFELTDRPELDAHGIECDSGKVQRAKLHPKHGHRVVQGDIQDLKIESREWDYAMLNEVLEQVPDDVAALQEVHRILESGGLLFVFSPNRWFPFETHGVYLKKSGRCVPPWVPFMPYIPLSLGNRFLGYRARNYGSVPGTVKRQK